MYENIYRRPAGLQCVYIEIFSSLLLLIVGTQALADAGIRYDDVEAVVASYCYGEPTCGQRAAYELGLTGVPIFNTNNNCSSGSSALMLAKQLVASGTYNCVMALGKQLNTNNSLNSSLPPVISVC